MGKAAIAGLLSLLVMTGCRDPIAEQAKAPALRPSAVFEGLPLSGNLATALAAGFGDCLADNIVLRCTKRQVRVMGVGPVLAAVDIGLKSRRFDHVTLWHRTDQSLLLELRPLLGTSGWRSCLTADEERFWRPPNPIRIAIDTNYWANRRAVLSAPPPVRQPYCP